MKNYSRRDRIYERAISNENIYLAIHLVHSYILNVELLSEADQSLFNQLRNRFNTEIVKSVLNDVKMRLISLINNSEEFFFATTYFKPKNMKMLMLFSDRFIQRPFVIKSQ